MKDEFPTWKRDFAENGFVIIENLLDGAALFKA